MEKYKNVYNKEEILLKMMIKHPLKQYLFKSNKFKKENIKG
jgi:hypothetical protein